MSTCIFFFHKLGKDNNLSISSFLLLYNKLILVVIFLTSLVPSKKYNYETFLLLVHGLRIIGGIL